MTMSNYECIRVRDSDSLLERLIGVIMGYRRGCSIDYVVLIMNIVMKRTQP